MNKERYLNVLHWAEEKPIRKNILIGLNKVLPVVLASMYILSLCMCFFVYPVYCIRLIIRPAACFILITIIRNVVKAPRPYDTYEFVPLCGYHPGKNKSFPSRHTGSAAIIALEIFHLWRFPGTIALIMAIIVAIVRVVCGNHYIKDVIIAFLVALLINIL